MAGDPTICLIVNTDQPPVAPPEQDQGSHMLDIIDRDRQAPVAVVCAYSRRPGGHHLQFAKTFMSWWLAVLGIGAALFYAFETGAAQHVFLGDVTRVTWLTAALALVVTVVLGRAAHNPKGAERLLEIGLFAEDACMRLGMFGTVVGCLIMFGADISSFQIGDPSKTAGLIQKISSSFGTAIGTTAVGIAASL